MGDRAVTAFLRAACLGAALAGWLVIGCGPSGQVEPTEAVSESSESAGESGTGPALHAGDVLEAELAGGGRIVYPLAVAGDGETAIEVHVEQLGLDVVLLLLDPSGNVVVEVDSRTGAHGVERLVHVHDAAGRDRLVIEAFPALHPGRYRLQVVTLGQAEESDRSRATARALLAAGERSTRTGELADAEEKLQRGLEVCTRLGEDFWLGEAHERLGQLYLRSEDWDRARRHLSAAVELYAAAGDMLRQGLTSNQLGNVLRRQGDARGAVVRYRAALRLARQGGSRYGEAEALSNLGSGLLRLGQPQPALDAYREALAIWRELELDSERAVALLNLGQLQLDLGQTERGLDHLRAAEALFERLGERDRLAITLDKLGLAHRDLGELDPAVAALDKALEILRQNGSRRDRAVTENNLARVLRERGDLEAAGDLYRRSLQTFVELGDRSSEARAIHNLAVLARQQGRFGDAEAGLRQALAVYRELGDLDQESETLYGLARVARAEGRLEEALELVEEALTLEEGLRRELVNPDQRTSSVATFHHRYGFSIDLLMELHGRSPGAGHDARAFLVSERSRARSWVELWLAARRIDEDPELLAQERHEQQQLNRLARARAAATASERRQIDRRLRAAREAWQEVRGRQQPLLGVEIEPLTARQAARLLDRETALLEIALGEDRSVAWLVEPHRLETFTLPPAAEIEALARSAHRLHAVSHRRESAARTRSVLCRLSEALLGPLRDHLEAERLALVVDGALHYVPFAALPDPRQLDDCASAEPLVARHQIVYLPSASALAAQRQALAGRPRPRQAVAALADPIFERDDPRLPALEPSPAAPPGRPFVRLPFSRQEADIILSLAPPGSRLITGAEAAKSRVLAGELAGAAIVHFATHGVLDTAHPELSSLVLSRFDAAGRPVDGFLRLHEIPRLRLDADLVVLSACQTALGKEARGHGLIGLTQGFFQAGAASVLVSLWQVDDASTRQLMASFYRALLQHDLAPAAALRHAQLELWRQPRTRAPFFWAPFVLQGDWRSAGSSSGF